MLILSKRRRYASTTRHTRQSISPSNPSAETNMTFTCNGELDKDCPLDVIARFVK